MPNATAFPTAAKLAALQALCPSGNTYKLALYTSAATMGAGSTVYAAANEVTGAGYTAGGATLTGYAASLDGTTAILDFADPSWANSTITARGAAIYDATNGNKLIAVLDFGSDVTSTNGTFNVALPAPAAATAVVRIA